MATLFLPNTFFAIAVVLGSCFLHSNALVNYLNQSCYEVEGTYDIFRASDFPTNRDAALDRLTSLASSSYFKTNITGVGESKVFALFACRYDVSLDVCQQCVTAAADQIKIWCFLNVEAIIFYDECRLHYANHSIFAIEEDLPNEFVFSIDKVDDVGEFNPVLVSTITSLINDVVSGFRNSSRYFATTEASYKSDTISALAQCNPDITSSDCRVCLRNAFGNFTLNYTGAGIGRMYTPSCLLTYKLSSFDDGQPNSPFNPPSSPDDNVPDTPFNFPSPDDNVPEAPFSFPTGNSPRTRGTSPFLESAGSSIYGSIMASTFVAILSSVFLY